MAQQHLQPPFAVAMLTYFRYGLAAATLKPSFTCPTRSYFLLFMMGHFRDWLDYLIGRRRQSAREGYAPLRQNYEDFYTRRLYLRIAVRLLPVQGHHARGPTTGCLQPADLQRA